MGSRGSGWALPPSVGKLHTLQLFSWLSSLDKVRIVCQWAVMPGMLSAGSLCVCLNVSHTLFCLSSSSLDLRWHPHAPWTLKWNNRYYSSPESYFSTSKYTPPASHCPIKDSPICTLQQHVLACSIRPSWHHFLNECTHTYVHICLVIQSLSQTTVQLYEFCWPPLK